MTVGRNRTAELTCSLVVRCFNEERHIGRLLQGVTQQTVQPKEIIVVDSGSTDRSLEIVRRFPVQVVHIRPEEFSFGRSLNRGCREATGDVLVFASAHTYPVYPDWLERLVEPFADRDIALVYGKQRGSEDTSYAEKQIFRSWFPDHSNGNQIHPFCNNANAAVRRTVWVRIPYDESLTGLEDVAWAKQALARGHRLVYEADAEVIHLHDETSGQIFNRYRREAMAMRAIEPAMRFRFFDFLLLWCANTFSDWRSAGAEKELRRHFFDIARFRLLQFWGTYRGSSRYAPLTERLRLHLYYPGPGGPSQSPPRPRRCTIDYGREELSGGDP